MPKKYKKRVAALTKSLKDGYIYENYPDDEDEYTHARPNANYGQWKVYSKDIDHEYRFVYCIGNIKEKLIDGEMKLIVPIKLVECMDHDDDEEIKDRIKGTGNKYKGWKSSL